MTFATCDNMIVTLARLPIEDVTEGCGMTQAIIVGGMAFVAMVAAAGGVLWFTARHRQSDN
ncbi:hypothetical protein GCM10023192_60770 [Amycolatopsis samaneae]